jgi:hypothetical protein
MSAKFAAALAGIALALTACSAGDDNDAPPARSDAASDAPLARSATNRPDEQEGPQVQLVYALPSDGEDRRLDTDGTIAHSFEAIQRWLLRETDPARNFRVDTYEGEYDILFFRSPQTDSALASTGAFVRDALEAQMGEAGLIEEGKVYAVYYDGSSTYACGGGAWPPALEGVVAAMYLRGNVPGVYDCRDNGFATDVDDPDDAEYVMAHEILHTLGFIATCAPNEQDQGHTQDSKFDLMYNGPDDEGDREPRRLDVGHDDYYGHDNAGCPDFADSEYLAEAE